MQRLAATFFLVVILRLSIDTLAGPRSNRAVSPRSEFAPTRGDLPDYLPKTPQKNSSFEESQMAAKIKDNTFTYRALDRCKS